MLLFTSDLRPLAAGLLGKLDYIGSISGSSWFTNLLGYDEAFFNQIKETSKPIGQVVSEFGDRWEQKMSDEHASWRASDSFADRAESITQFITFGSGFDTIEVQPPFVRAGSPWLTIARNRASHLWTCAL